MDKGSQTGVHKLGCTHGRTHCNSPPHGTLERDSRTPKQYFRSFGGASSTLARRDAEFPSRPVEAAQESFTFWSSGCLHATSNRGEPPSDSAEEALASPMDRLQALFEHQLQRAVMYECICCPVVLVQFADDTNVFVSQEMHQSRTPASLHTLLRIRNTNGPHGCLSWRYST